jgi:hypothetical protein
MIASWAHHQYAYAYALLRKLNVGKKVIINNLLNELKS